MAVTVTFANIPDDYAQRIAAAFVREQNKLTKYAGQVKSENKYNVLTKNQGENNMAFGKRCIAQLVKEFVKASEYNLDKSRHDSEVQGITPPSENVPEDLI